jgi:hypothetical protein
MMANFFAGRCNIGSMEFRAAIYMSFKKTQCSLSFIVINDKCHLIINFAQLFYILVIDFQSLIKDCSVFRK